MCPSVGFPLRSVNSLKASAVSNKLANIDFPLDIVNRSQRWAEAKNAALNLCASPRVEHIEISYKGFPKSEMRLNMAKGISTPFDCAKHLSQMLCDRSVIALVNGCPHDMHRPITDGGTLEFIHFKDIHHDPTEANLAFWHSCQIIMASAIESSFKDAFRMRLLSFQKTSPQSGSFVADFRMTFSSNEFYEKMIKWIPTECDLRALSQVGQLIASKAQPFECLNTNLEDIKQILQDDCRLQSLRKETGSASPTLYRIGTYVQAHPETPMIANSSLIGRFSIVSLRLLGRLEGEYVQPNEPGSQLVYRAQGVAIPTAFLTHFTTYDLLIRRARLPNPTVTDTPDYTKPI